MTTRRILFAAFAAALAEDFGKLIVAEYERWGRVVKASGARVE